jgi:hypothetical protein
VPKTTSRFALPYPEDKDAPDGPSQLQALAEAAETRLGYAGAQSGKSIIATEQSRESASYGLLGTPDRVEGIVLPTDGFIVVSFAALFKSSVEGAGCAAIFLNANQVKSVEDVANEAKTASAGTFRRIRSEEGFGLISYPGASGYPTTGNLIGVVDIFAPAGTYTVSAQFKATSGSVAAKERKLWCWTKEFP